nr:hypothetical protein [Methylocystis sp. H62]
MTAQAPSASHKIVASRGEANNFDPGCRSDVVARLKIARLTDQVGEAVKFFPGKMQCETSAHAKPGRRRPGFFMSDRLAFGAWTPD